MLFPGGASTEPFVAAAVRFTQALSGPAARGEPDDGVQIFLNHTLWNCEDDRIMFYARSGAFWHGDAKKTLNVMFTVRPDGRSTVTRSNGSSSCRSRILAFMQLPDDGWS